jgi:hypothetical protein
MRNTSHGQAAQAARQINPVRQAEWREMADDPAGWHARAALGSVSRGMPAAQAVRLTLQAWRENTAVLRADAGLELSNSEGMPMTEIDVLREMRRMLGLDPKRFAGQPAPQDPLAEQARAALSRADAQTYGDYMSLAAEGEPDFIELAAESERQDAELELAGGQGAIELARRREARRDPSICGNPDAYGRCSSPHHLISCLAAVETAEQRLSFADPQDHRAVKRAQEDVMVMNNIAEMAVEEIEERFPGYSNRDGGPFTLAAMVSGRPMTRMARLHREPGGEGEPMPAMTPAAEAVAGMLGTGKDPAPW